MVRSFILRRSCAALVAMAGAGALFLPIGASAATLPSERGVNVTFYDYTAYPDSFIASQSSAYASYLSGTLHANTVTVSFPLWTKSIRSNSVAAGVDPVAGNASTPTVDRLDVLVGALTRAGLAVRLRPLINESALELHDSWRGKLAPRNPSRWFASYRAAIDPYVALAERDHIASFVVETELQSLGGDPHWTSLIHHLAHRFSGTLEWDSTWGIHGGPGYTTKAGTTFAIDAYPKMHLGNHATVAQLVSGWADYLARNPLPVPPSVTVLQEVGILASTKMYAAPYLHAPPPGAVFQSETQVRWFKAACRIARRFGFKGISFNTFYLTVPIPSVDDPGRPQFFQPAGLSAISACFNR